MIYAAKFTGRLLGAVTTYRVNTYCYGNNEEAAKLELYSRYQDVAGLKLELRPIVTVGSCKVADYIYRVENGRLMGHTMPYESAYRICDRSDLVCFDAYTDHITCRNSVGVLVPVAADVTCIVLPVNQV